MKLRYLVLLLAAVGCGKPQPPPARNPIGPRAGAGTLTLTTNGSGAASLSGDPNAGYALNVPYFAGFLTTNNTTGAATVMNGVMNIPNYATSGGGVTLPSGSFPGQSLVVGSNNMLAAVNPGIGEAASSPAIAAMPSCGTTSSLGDLSQTFVLPTGATVMVPSGSCPNAVFYFFAQGAATFSTSGGQVLNIYNGAAYTTGTTYAASAGQYITLVRSKATNTWIMAIGNAGASTGMVPTGSTGITSLTTSGTGPSTYNSTTGALNVPDYSTTGLAIPSGALPGQVLAVGQTGNMIAGSPGLSDSVASPVSTSPYNPSCGTADTGDRSHVTVVTAVVTVNIPTATNAACNHAVFYFLMRAAATLQSSGGDTFDIYNGAQALAGQSAYTAAAGQYITVANGGGTNWHLMVGYSSAGPINLQQHYFSPDFTMTAVTTVASTGQGTNPITLMVTPQALCSFYLIIDTPTANTKIQAHIYRTTGTIPALGAAPGGADAQVAIVTFPYAGTGALTTVSGTIYDVVGTPVTGTPYSYYLALDSAASQNINVHSQSYLQVAEVK